MNVSLTPELEKFVASEVKTGMYQTASEVVRAGLRLLNQERLNRQLSIRSKADLEVKLLEAVQSLDDGRGVESDQVFKRLRQRTHVSQNG